MKSILFTANCTREGGNQNKDYNYIIQIYYKEHVAMKELAMYVTQ